MIQKVHDYTEVQKQHKYRPDSTKYKTRKGGSYRRVHRPLIDAPNSRFCLDNCCFASTQEFFASRLVRPTPKPNFALFIPLKIMEGLGEMFESRF